MKIDALSASQNFAFKQVLPKTLVSHSSLKTDGHSPRFGNQATNLISLIGLGGIIFVFLSGLIAGTLSDGGIRSTTPRPQDNDDEDYPPIHFPDDE